MIGPSISFGPNAPVNPASHITPFQCILGYSKSLFPCHAKPCDILQVEQWYQGAKKVWHSVRQTLSNQPIQQKTQTDKRRRPPLPYRVGQHVWLSTKNLKLSSCYKLSARYIRPLKTLGPNTYRFSLPKVYRICPAFHLSLLKPARFRPAHPSADAVVPPPPIIQECSPVYHVLALLDSRRQAGQL